MSNVFDVSRTTKTELPSWYSDAQKAAATGAKTALDAATPYGSTVLTGVTDAFSKPDNAYTQATNNLLDIQKGNATAYNADGTINTASPLGRLFSAQNAQLNQMLPGITGKEGAVGIGGGNFGSLRGQTATQTARGGALTTMQEQQAKAMLDAQNQSIQAGLGVGNLQQQYGTQGINLHNAQLLGGLPAYSKYQDILGAIAPTLDTTKTETQSQSDYQNVLSSIGAISDIGKSIGLPGLDMTKLLSGKTGYSWYDDLFKSNPSSGAITWNDNAGNQDTSSYYGNNSSSGGGNETSSSGLGISPEYTGDRFGG